MFLSIRNANKKKQIKNRKARFDQIMLAVDSVVEQDRMALPSLVRLIGKTLQARYAFHALHFPVHKNKIVADLDQLFFGSLRPIAEDGRSLQMMPGYKGHDAEPNSQYRLDLARDIIIPEARDRDKLIESMTTIGEGRQKGAFLSNSNHQVCCILPIGISIVTGGNHSISAGIADGHGTVVTTSIRSLVPAYAHVYYDGDSFCRRHDGYILNKPMHEEPGILFEIGRRMLETGVAYDAPIATPDELKKQLGRGKQSTNIPRSLKAE
jgi:hypothetical protein